MLSNSINISSSILSRSPRNAFFRTYRLLVKNGKRKNDFLLKILAPCIISISVSPPVGDENESRDSYPARLIL